MARLSDKKRHLGELAAMDRELARDMRSARARTIRAVAATARAMHGEKRAGRAIEQLLRTAWRRPPRPALRKRISASLGGGRVAPRTGARDHTVSVHFAMARTSSVSAAKSHQNYIEREAPCVATFGNIEGGERERTRVWEAIGERGPKRSGLVKVGPEAPLSIKRALARDADHLAEEGRLPEHVAEKLKRLARSNDAKKLAQTEIGLATKDAEDHEKLCAAVAAMTRQQSAGESKRLSLPEGVTEWAPRSSIVQRRLVLELPHELAATPDRMAQALRQWCETTLSNAGIAWHAAVHQPEQGNDNRNWHAHVVFAQIPVKRSADGTRFTFEAQQRLPKVVPEIRSISGNGPGKRREAARTVKAWRSQWCDILNEALERDGHEKRYDPRSYSDRGIDREAGQHRGPERTRIDETAHGAAYWEQAAPEWTSIENAWKARLEWLGADRPTTDAHVAHLERVRLRSGLAAQGVGTEDPIAEHLAAELDPQRVPGEASTLLSLEAALTEALAAVEPEWVEDWSIVESEGHERDRRGASASALVEEAGGITAIEPWVDSGIPGAGAMLAAAREHQGARREWQRAAAAALSGDDGEEARDARSEEIMERAASEDRGLDALVEARVHDELRQRSQRMGRRRTARHAREERRTGIEAATDPQTVARAAAALMSEHAPYWTEDAPDEGRTLQRWTQAAQGAARIRAEFSAACAKGDERALLEVLQRLEASDERGRAAALALSEDEAAYMRQCAASAAEAREHYRRINKRADEAKRMLDADQMAGEPRPATVLALWENTDLREDLARGARGHYAWLERLASGAAKRRDALKERCENAGNEPRECALALAADPPCLELAADEAQIESMRSAAEAWARWLEKELERATGEDDDAYQRRLAMTLDTHEQRALRAHGHTSQRAGTLCDTVDEANRTEKAGIVKTRNEAKSADTALTNPDAAERRRAYATLDRLLGNPTARARIGERECERLERRRRHVPALARRRDGAER